MADCVFLRRRYDCDRLTLKTLFENAYVINTGTSSSMHTGWNDSELYEYISVSGSLGFVGHNVYFFVFCDGYIGIWKVNSNGTGLISTPIKKSSSSKCGINNRSAMNYYYDGGYVSNTSMYSTPVFGASMVQVTFPDEYPSSEIDQILSSATVTRLAGRNSAVTGSVLTNDKTKAIYLAACSGAMSAWEVKNNTYEQVFTSTAGAYAMKSAYVNGQYLQVCESSNPSGDIKVYGGSIIGLS